MDKTKAEIIMEIREWAISHAGDISNHGIKHWDRVYENGQRLITPEVDPLVLGTFAFIHDICRFDDGMDIDHGKRSATLVGRIRTTVLSNLDDDEIDLLRQACRYPSIMHRTGDATIDACFDTDRLDLWRVGIRPDPRRMATEKGPQ